jgi:squalene-hopene/tetraprenyl-beta-curcumene cyclase
MAKALAAAGIDVIETPDGVKHDWRAELTAALAKRQRPDGSWVNEADRWMEGDPNLVTGYALMALSYCRPKP